MSFQVLSVARAIENGADLMESKAVAEAVYPKIGVYFTVDTLKFLYKGGRIGSAKHLFGTVLKIRPIHVSNRPRARLRRIGRADELAEELDGPLLLELDPHDIARNDVADEIDEEMLPFVHRVE